MNTQVQYIHQTAPHFRGPEVMRLTGVSYKNLDHWDRCQVLSPSIMGANGSGTQRLYSGRDVQLLKIAKQMRDAGLSLDLVRAMVEQTSDVPAETLARRLIVIANGLVVCTGPEEIGQYLASMAAGETVHVLRPSPIETLVGHSL